MEPEPPEQQPLHMHPAHHPVGSTHFCCTVAWIEVFHSSETVELSPGHSRRSRTRCLRP